MKKILKAVSLLLAIALLHSACTVTSKTSDPALRTRLLSRAEARDLTIQVSEMIPMQGNSQFVSSGYSLVIQGDSITSHLPYFGRAYAAPYSGGNVFSFDAPVLKYSVDSRKKGVVKVMVSTKTIDDNFTFYIELYENNKVSVRVNTVNRQGISYLGELTD